MPKRFPILLLLACLAATGMQAQSINRDFRAVADSLRVRLEERTGVKTPLRLDKVMRRGDLVDIYFSQELSDYPWHKEDVDWFRKELKALTPAAWRKEKYGEIFGKGVMLDELVTPVLSKDGKPVANDLRVKDRKGYPMVEELGGQTFTKGMTGRHIALWQSHGRYFEEKTDRWEWQRAPIHRTVEDMYTQSYVLPFLIPMLENAGAYVLTPRERDTQREEVICDNDPMFPAGEAPRTRGKYHEKGDWSDAGTGFADAKAVYTGYDNPFTMGTARQAEVTEHKHATATARWRPEHEAPWRAAVYVSYRTLKNSSDAAHYTVRHRGGETHFAVNQKMGGGMWVYLGTFDLDGDSEVVLDNMVPSSRKYVKNSVVTADAVRFGGGVGKIARGLPDTDRAKWTTSGLPCFTEGALYSMQWSGLDMKMLDDWSSDYNKDYAGRGVWVSNLSGGSRANPKRSGRGIPFDLSFAFHTDAGTTPDDSIVGTLSIYTSLCDGKDVLPDGESRRNGRVLADLVQTQIVQDIQKDFEPEWQRRPLWDRSYSESRTPPVPAMLLELLSHQNLADMKYGLDPGFRFTVSRAIYKGMLKYLSNRYGVSAAVQPLPVESFAAILGKGTAELSWKPVRDPIEPTAGAKGFILYTRKDDGAFDGGVVLQETEEKDGRTCVTVPVEKGHLYSFRIVAFNDGGKSFPSEVLSVGIPHGATREVLVINNFTRVSSPVWFDTPAYGGFMDSIDGGVPYGHEINFIGQVYNFRRSDPWTDDDNPGFGASYTNRAGERIPGNTFDFPAVHGKALMAAGYAFSSTSAAAFPALDAGHYFAADLICGKQVTTKIGRGAVPKRYQVFPEPLRNALTAYAVAGGNILVSGAYIATDIWDRVYDITPDEAYREAAGEFAQNILGYKWITNFASQFNNLYAWKSPVFDGIEGLVRLGKDPRRIYSVEHPDGIAPASPAATPILRYRDTDITAGVAFQGTGWRAVSLGFPLEAADGDIGALTAAVMAYFSRP